VVTNQWAIVQVHITCLGDSELQGIMAEIVHEAAANGDAVAVDLLRELVKAQVGVRQGSDRSP
jgi:N-acetylglucosamine kinase-like BadF-type ATPase